MTKNEIIKKLQNILEMDINKESICKEHNLTEKDFYPFYHGYVSSCLRNIIEKEESDMIEEIEYLDDKGNEIIETNNGYIFINGSCVAEPGTDADFDKYAIEIQNGEGYYDITGKYRRY